MKVITYSHEDGKHCVFSAFRGEWLNFDHPEPEPGPKEFVNYVCDRNHPVEEHGLEQEDRGDFGMAGLGSRMRSMIPNMGVSTADIEAGVAGTRMRIVNRHGKRTTMALMVEPQTALAERVLQEHAPRALEHFLRRNAEYGDDNDFNLGVAGQYVDLSRKVQKLKRRWWENEPAKDGEESDYTIAMELIGHLLMALDMLEERDGSPEEDQGRGV